MPASGAKMHLQLEMRSNHMAAVDMQAMEEVLIPLFFGKKWSLKSAPELVAPKHGICKHASRKAILFLQSTHSRPHETHRPLAFRIWPAARAHWEASFTLLFALGSTEGRLKVEPLTGASFTAIFTWRSRTLRTSDDSSARSLMSSAGSWLIAAARDATWSAR